MPLNPPQPQWRQTTAWIVGASSGIGRATASALHRRGARVVVSARNAAALDEFVQQHPGALALPLDVTEAEAVKNAYITLVQRTGMPPSLVMACAGCYQALRATAFSLEQMRHHMDVNYFGTLNVLDAVLPHMLKVGQGHISVVGSVAGYRGLPNALAYGPTKAALNNLADGLYLDLHDQGLGVSIINPGFVETPLTAQNQFPMPGLMTPEQAAQEILRGWERGQFEIHFPWRLTLALKLLQMVRHSVYFAAVKRTTRL
jgi:short-subunit dehydrogenase